MISFNQKIQQKENGKKETENLYPLKYASFNKSKQKTRKKKATASRKGATKNIENSKSENLCSTIIYHKKIF